MLIYLFTWFILSLLIVSDEVNEDHVFSGLVAKRKLKLGPFAGAQSAKPAKPAFPISLPHDFRRVSAIIDVDVVPETHRRVRLHKHGSDKPLGFYIRDGTSVRVTPHGLEKVPGIFISRLVPGAWQRAPACSLSMMRCWR